MKFTDLSKNNLYSLNPTKSIKVVTAASASAVLRTASLLKRRLEEARQKLSNRSLGSSGLIHSNDSSFLSVSDGSDSEAKGKENERNGTTSTTAQKQKPTLKPMLVSTTSLTDDGTIQQGSSCVIQ